MAEARLEIERSIDFDAEPSLEGHDRAVWLFEATSDPERRALIMGHTSMQKLAELGSTASKLRPRRGSIPGVALVRQ